MDNHIERLHATRTMPAFVRALAEAHGEVPAVDLEGSTLSYCDVDEHSAVLACGLLHRGVSKGSRIAILAANGPEFAVALAAVVRIGAVAVPLSTLSRPPELARVLRHGDVHGVLTQRAYLGQDFARNLAEAFPTLEASDGSPLSLPEAPFLRWVVFVADEPPPWAHGAEWLHQGLPAGFDDRILRAAEAEVHPDDPALMIYTSGQSAEPKGVVLGHGAVMGKVHYLREMFGFGPESRVAATLPFFWVGGLVMSLLTTFDAGGTVICRRNPYQKPPMLGAIGAARPDFTVSGARMLVGLGMSETFGPYSWGREMPDPARPLCPPLVAFEPGYDVKVLDADGNEVPEGETGEIALRGPSLMLGLHKVARSSTFDADGYYRTGDRVEVGADALYFVGRLGDMIKASGANVAPAEVERELLTIDGVAAAHVVGIDDAERGQIVGAAVVLDEGASLDRASILAALRSRLSTYKVPRILEILNSDELPMLPTNKLARRKLAALLRERAPG